MSKNKKPTIRLETVLKEKGITKYRFSKLLNKTTGSVSVYFREGYSPNFSTLERWAEVLDCKIRDLIDE